MPREGLDYALRCPAPAGEYRRIQARQRRRPVMGGVFIAALFALVALLSIAASLGWLT